MDLIVRGGTIVDGSGMPAYRGDVGVSEGRIVAIGKISEKARQEVDAEGQFVSPGFVNCHTHLDAQVNWDPLGTSTSWHGVTSVVLGNCGFTLAPGRSTEIDLALRSLERAEDIPREAVLQGVDWQWETYAEYLETLDRLPKSMNYAGYIGHSALRAYVMGERAFSEAATDDDISAMKREVESAIRAGAVGFSTSRST